MVGLSVRAVDSFIWEICASNTTGVNIVRLAPDVAADFPTEEAVNEVLRFVLKVMDEQEHLAREIMACFGATTLVVAGFFIGYQGNQNAKCRGTTCIFVSRW